MLVLSTFITRLIITQMINEWEEPENFFWVGIGGKMKRYVDAPLMNSQRKLVITSGGTVLLSLIYTYRAFPL